MYIVVAFTLVALASVFLLGHRANRIGEYTALTAQLAKELLEEVQLRKFDQTQPDARPAYPSYSLSALGTDAGENPADKKTFNDIDDFRGWTESPPTDPLQRALPGLAGYQRSVTVSYVKPDLSVSTTTTDFKRVTVCAERPAAAKTCLDWLATNL